MRQQEQDQVLPRMRQGKACRGGSRPLRWGDLGKEGDFAGKIVTHRVKAVIPGENEEYRFITQGLTNSIADPEITASQIQGKVIYRTVILSFISKLVNNLYSMYFVIGSLGKKAMWKIQ